MESNEVANGHPEIPGIIDSTKSYLYEKLWKLCAGPFVDIPKIGENVYYFPQGHIEHLEKCTNEFTSHMKQNCDLPSKILCRVTGIHLEVEKDSDEVYSHITLMSDLVQIAIPTPNDYCQRPVVRSFSKMLTVSDTNMPGGLSIPKRHATKCLPPLDMSQQTPTQELVAKDLNGYEWRFKHIFRGTPRRHLFTNGWTVFVSTKHLVAGDFFVFVRGENGKLRVGIRKAMHQQENKASSIISTEAMHHGVIAYAVHAINEHSTFAVVYKPRLSQFVISEDKFADAMNNNFNVGSRFMMKFEVEGFTEKRYSGTVVGVNDFSPHWKNSEWRRLEVQWDENAPIRRPNKVSPWEISLLAPSLNVSQLALLPKNWPCQSNKIGSTSTNMLIPALNQGQEIGQSSTSYPISVDQLGYHNANKDPKISSNWLMSSCSIPAMAKPNHTDQMGFPMKEHIATDSATSCRLFGVDLMDHMKTKDHLESIGSYQKSEIVEKRDFDLNQTLVLSKENNSKQIHSTRNCIKVHMQGVSVGRTVDLTVLNGYNQLIDEIEKILNLKGELHNCNQWEIVFIDNEGDMILIGDNSWPEFCKMIKKIFIYSKEDVKKVKSANKFF